MTAQEFRTLDEVADHFGVERAALARNVHGCPAWCSSCSTDTDGAVFHRHTEVLDTELEVKVDLCVITDQHGESQPVEIVMRFGQEPPFTLAEAEHALTLMTGYLASL